MGSNLHTHIGPYMIATGSKEIFIDKKVNTCINEDCENNKNNKSVETKFCGMCSSSTSEKKYQEKKTIEATRDIINKNEFVDKLCCFDDDILISNQYSPFDRDKRKAILNGYGKNSLSLFDVDMNKEIEWFEKEYSEIIEYAKKEFGEDTITVTWGVVQYWN